MHRFPLKLILLLYYSYDANAFLTPHRHFTRTPMQRTISASPHFAKRYGPPESTPGQSNNPSQSTQDERGSVKLQFTKLLNEVMSSPSEEIPSLLTKNIDTILTTMQLDLIEEVIQDDLNSHPPDKRVEGWREERLEELSEVVDLIVTFVESFVEEAKSMEDLYKKLLGRIFKIIAKKENNQLEKDSDASVFSIGTSADMEATLDQVLAEESEAFTPGFLRHLEGECSRIANLPTISPESSKMLQILRVIQARVLEELGKEIGEGAIVLGQLLGYDDKSERLGVLDAGLTVRGTEFACELSALTGDALKGFEAVEDVDPGLVQRIKEIDERIGIFMEKNGFQ